MSVPYLADFQQYASKVCSRIQFTFQSIPAADSTAEMTLVQPEFHLTSLMALFVLAETSAPLIKAHQHKRGCMVLCERWDQLQAAVRAPPGGFQFTFMLQSKMLANVSRSQAELDSLLSDDKRRPALENKIALWQRVAREANDYDPCKQVNVVIQLTHPTLPYWSVLKAVIDGERLMDERQTKHLRGKVRIGRVQSTCEPRAGPEAYCMFSCANQCGKRESPQQRFRKCSRCRLVRYCSVDCQRQHWQAQHKAACHPAHAKAEASDMKSNGSEPSSSV